jgi:hypothetical protein
MLMEFRTLLLEGREVFPVHGKDQVVLVEVFRFDLSGSNTIDVVTSFSRSGNGPRVRRLADMKTVGTGRVNAHDLREACVIDKVAEYAFCTGRPANIAHAYEEDFCHNGAYCAGKPATCLDIF